MLIFCNIETTPLDSAETTPLPAMNLNLGIGKSSNNVNDTNRELLTQLTQSQNTTIHNSSKELVRQRARQNHGNPRNEKNDKTLPANDQKVE